MPKIFALRSRLLENQQSLDNDLDLFGHKQTDLGNQREQQQTASDFEFNPTTVTSKFDLRVTEEVDPLLADLDRPQESVDDLARVDLTSVDDFVEVEDEVVVDAANPVNNEPGRITSLLSSES